MSGTEKRCRGFRGVMALDVAPLLVRLLLGSIFIWAGLGKLSAKSHVPPEDAAALAALEIIEESQGGYPEGADVLNVKMLALSIHKATEPQTLEDGTTAPATWPAFLGSGHWPLIQAYTIAIFFEFIGGVLVILGLGTRFWAIGFVGVMAGALWLTQIGGPIISGTAVYGFLPPGRPPFDPGAWQHLMFQAVLLATSLALALTGPGRVAIDNLFARPRAADDFDDDDDDE